jgi:hypothetical protein
MTAPPTDDLGIETPGAASPRTFVLAAVPRAGCAASAASRQPARSYR